MNLYKNIMNSYNNIWIHESIYKLYKFINDFIINSCKYKGYYIKIYNCRVYKYLRFTFIIIKVKYIIQYIAKYNVLNIIFLKYILFYCS